MVGQRRLIENVKNFTIDTFPRSVLLVGEEGCGKHTLINEVIAPLLDLSVIDITDKISFDYLLDITIKATSNIYVIDLAKLTVNKQNVILKFLEEPPENAYVILISCTRSNVLSTILNRCYEFRFDVYSDEELLQICDNHSLISKFRTPGKLLNRMSVDIDSLSDLCTKILTMNKKASLSNLMTVSSKVNWNGKEAEKIDSSIFLDVLQNVSSQLFRDKDIAFYDYDLTREFIITSRSEIQFDRCRYFEKYLVELKYGGKA